jgi:hypothetical protein
MRFSFQAENTENCEEFDDEDHVILEEDLDLVTDTE